MTELMNAKEEFAAKRWFVIGAHQSGASDKTISNMVGLSTGSIHHIIAQFKKTGTPVGKRMSRKEPKSEYDEEGHLVDSDDELMECKSPKTKKIRRRRPSAEDVVNYVLTKAQQAPSEPIMCIREEEEEKESILIHQNRWRPPTPPYNQHPQPNFGQNSLPSPPLKELDFDSSNWTATEDKILMSHLLTRLSNERWPEAVAKLKGKHDIKSCKARWEILRELLLKGADKSGTRGW